MTPVPQRPRTPLAAWYESDGTEIPVDQMDMDEVPEEQVMLIDPPAHVNQMPLAEEFDGPVDGFVDLTAGTPLCNCGYPMGRYMAAPRKHLWRCLVTIGCDLKVWEVNLYQHVQQENHFQPIDVDL
jgi:hypothetical protein